MADSPVHSFFSWIASTRNRPRSRNVAFRLITVDELSRHSTTDDYWCVLDGLVYDLTPFLKYHPGGMNWRCAYSTVWQIFL